MKYRDISLESYRSAANLVPTIATVLSQFYIINASKYVIITVVIFRRV